MRINLTLCFIILFCFDVLFASTADRAIPSNLSLLQLDITNAPNQILRRRLLYLAHSCPIVNNEVCSNKGDCDLGRCKCFPGYAGKACKFKINDNQVFHVDCSQLKDQYTAFAIHETTVGACPQYRLVWSLIAQRTCKAMTGQSCNMNQRREFCMGMADCPDLCQTYFDIGCAKLSIDDSLQKNGRNTTSGRGSTFNFTNPHLRDKLYNNVLQFKSGTYSGQKAGIVKKRGWFGTANNLLSIRIGSQTIIAKGGSTKPRSRL